MAPVHSPKNSATGAEKIFRALAYYTTYHAFGLTSFAFEELLRWGFCDRIRNEETFGMVFLSFW